MNKTNSHDKLVFLKNWPVWLLFYEVFTILFNFGNMKGYLFKSYILGPIISILLFSILGLRIIFNCKHSKKITTYYIFFILIFLLVYSPLWAYLMVHFKIEIFYYMAIPLLSGVIFFGCIVIMVKYIKGWHLSVTLYWFLYFSIILISVIFATYAVPYEINLKQYLQGLAYMFIFFQFFMGPFYAVLLMPFTYFLIKNHNISSEYAGKTHLKLWKIVYLLVLAFLPWFGMHLFDNIF